MKMKTKAQGAMEYLMTYGWAILVVMIVGLAMWRLGVFDISQGGAPTSSGFGQLKPLLPSCRVGTGSWMSSYRGFSCIFYNAAGTSVNLKNISIRVNGKACRFMRTDIYPQGRVPGESKWIDRWCKSETVCNNNVRCREEPEDPESNCASWPVNIPSDDEFGVFAFVNSAQSETYPECWNIEPGKAYTVDVELVYDFKLGDDTVRKSSVGTIKLSG